MLKRTFNLMPATVRRRVFALCILSTLILTVSLAACAGPTLTPAPSLIQASGKAAFQLSRLRINPPEVTPSERVLIDVDLTNTGDIEGTYIVELKINDVVKVMKDVAIPPGETWRLTFRGPTETPGTYRVNLNELTGYFVVSKSAEPLALSNFNSTLPNQSTSSCGSCGTNQGTSSCGGCGTNQGSPSFSAGNRQSSTSSCCPQ